MLTEEYDKMAKNYPVSRNYLDFTINTIRVPIQCHPALLLGFLIFAAAALFATSSFGAATVYVPMVSGNEILIIDAEAHTITGRNRGVNAIHGLATAKGNDYLVAGSYAEYDDWATSAPPKPTVVSEDEQTNIRHITQNRRQKNKPRKV